MYGTTDVARSSALRPRSGRAYGARESRHGGRPRPLLWRSSFIGASPSPASVTADLRGTLRGCANFRVRIPTALRGWFLVLRMVYRSRTAAAPAPGWNGQPLHADAAAGGARLDARVRGSVRGD